MIKKVKDWLANKPQFEFIGEGGYEVRRLSDGIIFKVDHTYLYDDGIPLKSGEDVRFFYIKYFDSTDYKSVTFTITKSVTEPSLSFRCKINDLIYKKSGLLEIIRLDN